MTFGRCLAKSFPFVSGCFSKGGLSILSVHKERGRHSPSVVAAKCKGNTTPLRSDDRKMAIKNEKKADSEASDGSFVKGLFSNVRCLNNQLKVIRVDDLLSVKDRLAAGIVGRAFYQ